MPFILIFVAVLCALTGTASAADLSDDASQVFAAINPCSGISGYGSGNSVFLNEVLMPFAAFFLAGSIIFGVMNCAYEGKTMGGKYHVFYSPIKWVIGMAMLIPASGGFCGAQLAVLQIAKQGNQWGDDVVVAYVQAMSGNAGTTTYTGASTYTPTGLPLSVAGIAIAKQLLVDMTCQASFATTAQYSGTNADYVPPMPSQQGTQVGDTVSFDFGQCGSIEIAGSAITASVDQAASTQYLSDWRAAMTRLFAAVRDSGVPQNFALARQPGSGVTMPSSVMTVLQSAATQYETDVQAAAATMLKSTGAWNQFASSLTHWTQLGSGAMTLSAMSSQVAAMAGLMPSFSQPSLGDSILNYEITRDADRTVKLLLEKWDAEVAKHSSTLSTTVMTNITANDDADWLNSKMQQLLNPVTAWIINTFGTSNANNALQAESDYGHRLIIVAYAMIAAGGAGMLVAGNVAGTAAGLYALATWIAGPAWLVIAAVMACGFTSAYFMPLLPYLSMFAAETGWDIAILEAMVIVCFTFLFIIRMSGAEFLCEYFRPGLMLLFRLSVFPALCSLTYMGVTDFLPILLAAVDRNFASAFISSQSGHSSVLSGNVVAMCEMEFVKFQLEIRFYAAVVQIPGAIAHLIPAMPRVSHGEPQMFQQFQGGTDTGGAMGQAVGKTEGGATRNMENLANASKRGQAPTPMP